jgi:hypothetical protein
MALRGFSGVGAAGARRSGGEIFSNVKTGMVNPSTLDTECPWNFPGRSFVEASCDALRHKTFKPV